MALTEGTAYWATDELVRPARIRECLVSLGLRPRRSLGQNFLADGNIRKIILEACRLHSGGVVLEIGPGLGALTSGLIQIASRVVAIEKDPVLARFLEERFHHPPHLEVIPADILKLDLEDAIPAECDLIVSNLPYRVASPIMVRLLEHPRSAPHLVVTIHREAGEKFIAQPGTRDYGVLTIITALGWKVTVLHEISPNCFYPRPQVWSYLLDFSKRERVPPPELLSRIRHLTSWIFTQRRKKIGSIIRTFPADRFPWLRRQPDLSLLEAVKISPDVRPAEVTPEQWRELVEQLSR